MKYYYDGFIPLFVREKLLNIMRKNCKLFSFSLFYFVSEKINFHKQCIEGVAYFSIYVRDYPNSKFGCVLVTFQILCPHNFVFQTDIKLFTFVGS